MLQAEADEVLHHLASDYRLMLGSVAHGFSLVVQIFVVGKSNISVSVQLQWFHGNDCNQVCGEGAERAKTSLEVASERDEATQRS